MKEDLKMQKALPNLLRLVWIFLIPLGVAFAARIAWEKTVWTWSRGPQAVGFSLMHIHPYFAVFGSLCCYLLMLWSVPATIFLVARWKAATKMDKAMVLFSLLITAAIVLPDQFFAHTSH
jgi:hypothetical protein